MATSAKRRLRAVLLEGLRRLEYRGYDSAGVAILQEASLLVRKKTGKIDEGIARELLARPAPGEIGIAHTRWATHGPPCDENSHPHLDQSGSIAVVHNGVIENYDQLKQRLLAAGHHFHSSTDTEVLAHLIGDHYAKRSATKSELNPLTQAVGDALREVIGTYGIAVICTVYSGNKVGNCGSRFLNIIQEHDPNSATRSLHCGRLRFVG